MPREGLTLTQVEEIFDALKDAGVRPSYRRIRAKLGAGSLTTIANHVKEIERQRQLEYLPEESERPPLPDPVVQALFKGAETTWTQLLEAAEEVIAEARGAADEKVGAAEAAAQQAIKLRDEAEADNKRLSDALTDTRDELAGLTTAHETLQDNHRALEQKLAAAETQIAGLEALVDTLRHSNEQRVADAEKAHQRADVADQRLEAAQHAHATSLSALRKEAADERARWQREVAQEKERVVASEKALSASQADVKRLSAALETEAERSNQAQAQADTLREQRDQLLAHKAQLDERCHALQATVEQERERSDAMVAEKDARLGEQAEVIATLSATLQRMQDQRTGDDAVDA